MGAGQYDPSSHRGRLLLGHELTHVLQQRSDIIRRQPESTTCPEYVDDDWKLSREAPALLTTIGEEGANEAGMQEQDWIIANFAIGGSSLDAGKVENPMRFLIDLLSRAEEQRAWTNQGYFQRRFLLTGFADCIGGEKQNTALAQQRAEAVRDMMVAQLNEAGIAGNNADRVKIVAAVGEGHPFPQDSAEMRAMSRSVIIEEEWVSVPDEVAKSIEEEGLEKAEERRENFTRAMPESWLEHARASSNDNYRYWAETVAADWEAYMRSMQNDDRVMITTSHEIHVGTLESIMRLCDRSPEFCPIATSDG